MTISPSEVVTVAGPGSIPQNRTRPRRTKPNANSPTCIRESCSRLVTKSGHVYCSFICGAIAKELERAQRICETLGPDAPMAVELWTEAVAVSDGWSRVSQLDRLLYQAAREAGLTDEAWRAIKEGTA
ncbi:hypothetical protein BH11ACT6_BH11ACT6_29850 [soil metagenome]